MAKIFEKKKFENKMIYIFRFVIGLLWIVCIFISRYINDVKKILCGEVYPDASMIAVSTEKHLYWY